MSYYYEETYEVVEGSNPPRVSRYTTSSTPRRDDRDDRIRSGVSYVSRPRDNYQTPPRQDPRSNARDDRIKSGVSYVSPPLDDYETARGYRDAHAPRQGRSSNARDEKIRSGVSYVTRPPTNLPPSDPRSNVPPSTSYSQSYAQAPPTQVPHANDFASNKGYAAHQTSQYSGQSTPRDKYSERDKYSPRDKYSERDNYSSRDGYNDRDNYGPRNGCGDRDNRSARDNYSKPPPRRQSSTIPPRATGSGSNRRAEERLRQEEEIRKEEERIRQEDRRSDKEKRQWFFAQVGCSESDSIDKIKKAHRKAQIKMHPDKHPNETEKYNDMFAKLNEEFDKIEKRAAREAARV
jgi:hypothetical protein